MFLGHFAVGLAAKRMAPEVSLGTLFLAAQLADLVWPTLVLAGIEAFSIRPGITAVTPLDFTRYPYSHGLAGMALCGAGLGLIYFILKPRVFAALFLFPVVMSHWLLDFVSHRPDLPLTLTGAERFGLGLWHSRIATLAVEGLLFAACAWIYARSTRALDRIGRWSLAGLIVFLVCIYLANIFGPPPPSVAAVAWSAQAIWLLVAWGYWIDRHRTPARN
ncbi:MAG TPA: hypothetical protein VFR66_12675 [Burkholderiales bacterium]|nr:hypothetical protein [Burkholderiales bacterium]